MKKLVFVFLSYINIYDKYNLNMSFGKAFFLIFLVICVCVGNSSSKVKKTNLRKETIHSNTINTSFLISSITIKDKSSEEKNKTEKTGDTTCKGSTCPNPKYISE